MAGRRYTPEERTEALTLYTEEGPRAAHRATGISLRTIYRWADEEGVARLHAERTAEATAAHKRNAEHRRTVLADKLWRLADLAADVELELLPEDASLRDVVGLRTRAIHDALLLTGQATSRTEQVTTDSIDAEVRRLAEQLNLTREPAE